MSKGKIKARDLDPIGLPVSLMGEVLDVFDREYSHDKRSYKMRLVKKVIAHPEHYLKDPAWGKIARELHEQRTEGTIPTLREKGEHFTVYGADQIEEGAYEQMELAMRLPIALKGALMPDAHQGYGLPIGGVLAADHAVIPFGVGVDIGCRMCMTVYDVPKNWLEAHEEQLSKDLLNNTRFGTGCTHEHPFDDPVFERSEFKEIPVVRSLKDLAYTQIGTSGGGNHFVDIGVLDVVDPKNDMKLPVGTYLAVLSHSGSRGLGASLADYYTKLAMEKCPLPNRAKFLAWLSLASQEGQEYWSAMSLAGDYASASHHHIHRRMAASLGEEPLTMIENHHNFAWKEVLSNGQEVVVHRKGATPASKGVLGIIPGSMASPGFVVRGKGDPGSINSCAHGAGRVLSRRAAKRQLNRRQMEEALEVKHIHLLGGGLDEAPMVYKDIEVVMEAQKDLVEVLAVFYPKIVRMAS